VPRTTGRLCRAAIALLAVAATGCAGPGERAVPAAAGATAPSAGSTAPSTAAASPAPSGPVPGTETTGCTVVAAGDIASADGRAADTARLVETVAPERVLTLGDNAYESGTIDQFRAHYEPTWGRFKSITLPAPGNHEYKTGGEGYFAYFGVPPYYGADVCGWRVLSMNSEIDLRPQAEWLQADLAGRPTTPTLAYWHRPRFSSAEHGSDPDMQPLWAAAVEAGVDVVLTGHDHVYERFGPMNADGVGDPSGPRQFVIGTGGRSSYLFVGLEPNSEVRITDLPGVGVFQLGAQGYSWSFHGTDGTIRDSGSARLGR